LICQRTRSGYRLLRHSATSIAPLLADIILIAIDLVAAQIQLDHDRLLTDIELGKKALMVTAHNLVCTFIMATSRLCISI